MAKKKAKSSREKKRVSLSKGRRNGSAKHSKASRKNVPRRRAIKRRAVRRTVKRAVVVQGAVVDGMGATLVRAQLLAKSWRKMADVPLRVQIGKKMERRRKTGQAG